MSEWGTDQLGKIANFQKGRKVDTDTDEQSGYLPYLGAGSLTGKNDGYASTKNSVRATPKDVLMLWDGERSGLVGYNLEGVVSSTVSKLTPSGKVSAPYLYHYLNNSFQWIQNRRTGTGVPHVPKDLGRIMLVGYPNKEATQSKIVSILETIDQAIEKTETLIEKYSQIKAGMMHDLFTRGLTLEGKLRPPHDQALDLYQQTPVGWLPKQWKLRTLGSMSKIASGITLNSKFVAEQSVLVPYLRVANVQDGYLDLTEMKEVRAPKDTIARFSLQKDDVLMNEGGDFDKLGRGTVWPGEISPCIHQNHVFRVRVDKSILRPYFLTFWSQSLHGKRYFLLSSKQSTNLASINSKQLNSYPIGIPCLDEQLRIEERISAVNSKLEILTNEKHKLCAQKFGLMNDLLTGKVPVKADEPEQANV